MGVHALTVRNLWLVDQSVWGDVTFMGRSAATPPGISTRGSPRPEGPTWGASDVRELPDRPISRSTPPRTRRAPNTAYGPDTLHTSASRRHLPRSCEGWGRTSRCPSRRTQPAPTTIGKQPSGAPPRSGESRMTEPSCRGRCHTSPPPPAPGVTRCRWLRSVAGRRRSGAAGCLRPRSVSERTAVSSWRLVSNRSSCVDRSWWWRTGSHR